VRDQFGPEVIYFSDCILRNREPEPSGAEGLRDVHIIRSLYESAETGMAVKLKQIQRQRRPGLRQEIYRPRKIANPKLVHVEAPAKGM
jgi:glucose-fructose oxidoreductase